MARMKIALPDTWQFEYEMQVRVTDLNYGNHLANQQIFAYAQEARLAYFSSFGYTEMDFGGVSLIQADAAATYKCEGHLGDKIRIQLSAVQRGGSSFDVFYLMTNISKGRVLAEVRTAIACFNYEQGRPQSIPNTIIERKILI